MGGEELWSGTKKLKKSNLRVDKVMKNSKGRWLDTV